MCVGHYLLDLPAASIAKVDATYVGVKAEFLGNRKDIASLRREIEAEIAALSEQKMHDVPLQVQASMRARGEDPGQRISSERVLGVSSGPDYVVYGYHPDTRDSRFRVELHKLFANGDHYKFSDGGI